MMFFHSEHYGTELKKDKLQTDNVRKKKLVTYKTKG